MEEELDKSQTTKATQSGLAIQDMLSLGYVILLILGVFHETIYYKFVGINILEYSSILDVLISPVSVISGNLILGVVVIFCVLFALLYAKLLPKYYKWLGKKPKYQTGKKKEKLDKVSKQITSKNFLVTLVIIYIFSMFVGLGIGRGMKIKERIEKGDIRLTHEIIFQDGDAEKVKVLGKNSLYVFYVTKENLDVAIAPIEGNIKIIRKLNEEEEENLNED